MMNKNKEINEFKKRIETFLKEFKFSEKEKPQLIIKNSVVCFLIHGFGDTAFKMKYLATYLSEHDFSVYSTTIPGLTGRPYGIEVSYKLWLKQIKDEYLTLKRIFDKVIIIGFSTGATLAMNLVENMEEHLKPNKLVLISPALFFVNRYIPLSLQIIGMRIYTFFNPFPKRLNNSHLIYMDQVQREIFMNNERIDGKSVIEVLKLAKVTKKIIDNLKNLPVLIIHPANDIVVSPYSSEFLVKKLNRENVLYKKFYKSGHPIIVDLEKEACFYEIFLFIKDLA